MKTKAVIQVHTIVMNSEYKPSLLTLENTIITVILDDDGYVNTRYNPELNIHTTDYITDWYFGSVLLSPYEYTVLVSIPYED